MRKWIQILLPGFGILLTIISFFISEVENYPSLLCCLCWKHPQAMEGIKRLEALEESECFTRNDTGFAEVCDIAMELLKEGYGSTVLSSFMIEKFECVNKASISLPFGAGSFAGADFVVYLVDRLPIDIDIDTVKGLTKKGRINNNQLRKKLEERLEASLLHWRFGVFLAGILLMQIPMYVIQLREGHKKKS